MKKKYIVVILLLISLCTFNIVCVKADSGFDFDYGSSSGSSHSSSSSSHSSSSHSSSGSSSKHENTSYESTDSKDDKIGMIFEFSTFIILILLLVALRILEYILLYFSFVSICGPVSVSCAEESKP